MDAAPVHVDITVRVLQPIADESFFFDWRGFAEDTGGFQIALEKYHITELPNIPAQSTETQQ